MGGEGEGSGRVQGDRGIRETVDGREVRISGSEEQDKKQRRKGRGVWRDGEDGMHAPASTWSSYTLLCVELTTVALLPPSPSTQTYTHLTLSCWSPSVWSCSERTSGFAKWYADCSRERQHTSIHIHTTHTHTTYPRPHISPISVLRSYSRTIPRSGPSGRRSELGNSRSAYWYPDFRVRSPHVPFARAAAAQA